MTEILKEAEREIEVYPVAELVNAINKILKSNLKVKIALVSKESGDIIFTTTLNDLGITRDIFQQPFYRSHLLANFFGELLVRTNLNMFCDRVMDGNYHNLIKKYNHRDFGLRSGKNDILLFQFHISLIYQLMNELISQEISDEVSKVIISGAKKVKREEQKPSITTLANDKNTLRLQVSNHSSVSNLYENAIKMILDGFGIKNKTVFITQNMFSTEIEIKNENNEKSL